MRDKPAQERLEPHADVILNLQRQGTSYATIATKLDEEHGIKVSTSTLHAFVKAHTEPDAPDHHVPADTIPPDSSSTTLQEVLNQQVELRTQLTEMGEKLEGAVSGLATLSEKIDSLPTASRSPTDAAYDYLRRQLVSIWKRAFIVSFVFWVAVIIVVWVFTR